MISDKERREVAAKLRENAGLPSRLPNEYSIEVKSALVLSKLLDCIDCSDDVLLHLADLIDRPTCENLSVNPADVLLCSECGEHVFITYMRACKNYHAKYCPRCGAEVVS